MRARSAFLAAAIIGGSSVITARSETPTAELIEQGRQIYELGRLVSGEPLRADRGPIATTGEAAACIKCHQGSGYGVFEATNLVPPITGPSLFHNAQPRTDTTRQAKGMKHVAFPYLTRPPYDDATLARAIREGVSPNDYHFQFLMPRYPLGDADMSALIAYLRQLSTIPSPGMDQKDAHFATVIAPGQSPARRKAVVDVLKACFKSAYPEGGKGQVWHLHVWDLAGPPESWQTQLKAKYAEQPIFAFISGLGAGEWGPVHRFAEAERIPQLFPNIETTASSDVGRYSFYFWSGVPLEARVIARYLGEHAAANGLGRVVQLRRGDGLGAKAAETLRPLIKAPMTVEDRVLTGSGPEAIKAALSGLSPSDALVVWLDRGDVAALKGIAPPSAGQILFSGWLSGLENAPIPADWKLRSTMVYPLDSPQRRDLRMQFNLRPWLRDHSVADADEILQGNTLAACNLLVEGTLRLRGAFFRDYLVELTENYPTGMGNAPAPEAFPRFVIGPGQRYSSKGAYIVKFKAPGSNELDLVQDWIVPD